MGRGIFEAKESREGGWAAAQESWEGGHLLDDLGREGLARSRGEFAQEPTAERTPCTLPDCESGESKMVVSEPTESVLRTRFLRKSSRHQILEGLRTGLRTGLRMTF